MSLALIVGISVVCFALLYSAFNVDKEHTLLRIILIMSALFLLLLVPKSNLDDKDNCSFEVSNSTINYNTTSYNYDYFCSSNTNQTAETFYGRYLTLLIIISTYIIVFFSKDVVMFFGGIFNRR